MRIFSEAFRIFFLAASLFGAAVMLLWLGTGVYGEGALAAAAVPASQWHAHEMIFGYGAAAIGGFFLTAVPNWTGGEPARAGFIAAVFAVWGAGRLALWPTGIVGPFAAMAIDLAFVPMLAVQVVVQLMRTPKPQNVVLLSMLAALWIGNLLIHLEWCGFMGDTAAAGLAGGLMSLVGLIGVLGGRITPAFTRNAMKRAGVPEARWPITSEGVNRVTVACSLALPWVVMLVPDILSAVVALLAGGLHVARLSRWRCLWTRGQPILWSLHLAMGFLAIGLLLWGLANLGVGTELAAVHVLGIGCIGGMTLAVMSRAVLGHTGRPLVAPGLVVWAYTAMAGAALVRWGGQTILAAQYAPTLVISGGLWVVSMMLFAGAIAPMVMAPRVDS